MGSLFKSPKLETKSTLSPEQEALLSPLQAYLSQQIGATSPGVDDINQILTGRSSLMTSLTDNIYKSLLTSGVREYQDTVQPQIAGAFANVGGTLSTRRGQTIAQGLTKLQVDTQGQVAALQPNLLSNLLTGVTQREQLRFLPTQQAMTFALSPTRSMGQSPAGPGWGLLSDVLGAGGFIAGAAIGG